MVEKLSAIFFNVFIVGDRFKKSHSQIEVLFVSLFLRLIYLLVTKYVISSACKDYHLHSQLRICLSLEPNICLQVFDGPHSLLQVLGPIMQIKGLI